MPVEDGDEIVLVTNGGQLIRCPVDGIRVARARDAQGVISPDTDAAEQVVSRRADHRGRYLPCDDESLRSEGKGRRRLRVTRMQLATSAASGPGNHS